MPPTHNPALNNATDALLATFPELAVSPAQRLAINTLVPIRKLPARRLLFAQGQATQAFYAVLSGELEAGLTAANGSHSVLEHLQAPKIFGLAAFVSGQPSAYEARALRSSRVLVFDLQAYTYLMDQVGGFARALLCEFAQRYDGTLRQLAASRHDPAPSRFQAALRQLALQRNAQPQQEAGRIWLHFCATQQELAELASLSRQTTQQLVSEARSLGWLRQRYGQFWLSDGAWR